MKQWFVLASAATFVYGAAPELVGEETLEPPAATAILEAEVASAPEPLLETESPPAGEIVLFVPEAQGLPASPLEALAPPTPVEALVPATAAPQPLLPSQPPIPQPSEAFQPQRRSPTMAVFLSSLIPGLGHVYLGQMGTATGLFATSSLSAGTAVYPRASQSLRNNALIAAQATWSYGIYAAYRDARNFNGSANYSYQMPNDSLFDLTTAPFRFSVLKKPEVWGGLVGALAAGVGISYLAYSSNSPVTAQKFTTDTGLSPAIALPVGIGEESLFRGYLQSQLCEFFSPTTSIIVSSLAFGASHLPNALMLDPADRPRYFAVSIPFITALGGYMGWLTHKNHSLKESVALHTWYDFVLFAASIWADRAAGMRAPQHFSMSIPL